MKELKGRKRHSKAFRKDAVELLLTGRPMSELASELGVSAMTLSRWREEYLLELSTHPPDVANLPPLRMQEELIRLRKENARLKLHQEILKKPWAYSRTCRRAVCPDRAYEAAIPLSDQRFV